MCGQLVEANGDWDRNTEQSKRRANTEAEWNTKEVLLITQLQQSLEWWCFWVTVVHHQGEKKKTNYLELSTIYCTILSRTFSKRAVRTQMCLMAWAERGWGGRLVVEEPCLLRGSWPMLWVLLQDTKHNIISDCYYREDVMFVFVAWWTSDFWVWYWNEC